jgi:hypothetical protein
LVIKKAKDRLDNYNAAIEYCKTYNINTKGVDELAKNKKRIEDVIERMKTSDDPKEELFKMPNELSPETLFGNPIADINKEKAELISIVNKSINEHQKLLIALKEDNFKNKTEFKEKQKEIITQCEKQKAAKAKLEIVQTNRWWPVPEYVKSTASYFIPKSDKERSKEGEKFKVIVDVKKAPQNAKAKYQITCTSEGGHKDVHKYGNQNTINEEIAIPVKNYNDLKNYVVTLVRLEPTSG